MYQEYDGIFDYTLQSLERCKDIMNGADQHHPKNPSNWQSYMSSIEYYKMKTLIGVCRKIINDVDNGNNIFYKGDE